jgi:hypothetical protein
MRVPSWANDVMHRLSESEAKGWQALDFREANAIPEVEMQHYARRPLWRRRDVIISPRNLIDDVASDCCNDATLIINRREWRWLHPKLVMS